MSRARRPMKSSTSSRWPRPSRLEISRFLSQLERRDLAALRKVEKLFQARALQKTLCITGSAGVGKSSLLSAYIETFGADEKIAWLACDPTSSVSGGGLLGDRIRLNDSARDSWDSTQVFVRSLATRSEKPYSSAVRDMAIYLESYFDRVFIETTGIGQTQWEVSHLAPLTVLVLQPETGDDVQSMKAGVQEIADLLVVHKADLPGTSRLSASLRDSVSSSKPLVEVSSLHKQGLENLRAAINALQARATLGKDLSRLHQEHGRDLYLEKQRRLLDRSFAKLWKASGFNPYRMALGK